MQARLPAGRLLHCFSNPAARSLWSTASRCRSWFNVRNAADRSLHAASEASQPGYGGADERPPAVDLSVAIYMVWGADTDVGKTLISAGLADAAARASVRPASATACCSPSGGGCWECYMTVPAALRAI